MCSILHPEALGIILAKQSPRCVPLDVAQKIITNFKKIHFSPVQWVAVLIHPPLEEVKTLHFFDVFQLHGEESPEFCTLVKNIFPQKQVWKVFCPETEKDLEKIQEYKMCDTILLDAFSFEKRGGTGKMISLEILKNAKSFCAPHQKLIIAGGVSSKNFQEILSVSLSEGIDISSSVEQSVGHKDVKKMEILAEQFSVFYNG